MDVQGCLRVALLLLLSLQHGSVAQKSDGEADPETPIRYDISNQNDLFQNEAADDKLCLARNAIVTGKRLAERFHEDAVLSKEDFRRLLKDIQTGLQDYGADAFTEGCAAESANDVMTVNGLVVNCSELLTECPSFDEIYSRHTEKGGGLNYSHVAAALQEAAFSLANPKCQSSHGLHKGYKPTIGQAWGYGIGFVALVCIISNIGGLLTPLMSKTFFQRLLQFLVAMGAGTLVATGLLVLIPEAFDIVSIEELSGDYIWKSATALFSIYVFFVSERFLKFLLKSRETKNIKRQQSIHIEPISHEEEKDAMTSSAENGLSDHGHSHFVSPVEGEKRRGPVATVAWMVLIGDVMHNFVDGMAIGAAFTENVYLGVSIGIAVLCEELPHELGDVAILLHSGMSMKRALFLNFLSACVCFVGLVVGILLGENTEANRWILAVAGGLFLYVPLVDMLPDMSQHLDMKLREGTRTETDGKRIPREVWLILGCQSLGLIVGIGIILAVVNFVGEIEIS
ncbi:metal cation symporter ZIP14-like isoform X2 [Babylonia areolata]|uniref:metal cation symporter ZIP14-like isoform X2 n=1 Tax=Babylonia areolata TaxID=304850 RepID=UPI003FD3D79A